MLIYNDDLQRITVLVDKSLSSKLDGKPLRQAKSNSEGKD
jgi:hypothetical protein